MCGSSAYMSCEYCSQLGQNVRTSYAYGRSGSEKAILNVKSFPGSLGGGPSIKKYEGVDEER